VDQRPAGLRIESTGTIELLGDVDAATAPVFAEVLTAMMTNGADVSHVVVDMRRVSFIDSSGLAVLIGAEHRRDGDATLRLRSPSRQVRRLLEVSGLATYFDIDC
jgi:anti-anti-sigma factor